MIELNKMTKKERCWYIIDNVLIQSEADDISSYLDELEQQVTELKESQKQKQIIRLCQRLDKAEQQKAELIRILDVAVDLLSDCNYNFTLGKETLEKYI